MFEVSDVMFINVWHWKRLLPTCSFLSACFGTVNYDSLSL